MGFHVHRIRVRILSVFAVLIFFCTGPVRAEVLVHNWDQGKASIERVENLEPPVLKQPDSAQIAFPENPLPVIEVSSFGVKNLQNLTDSFRGRTLSEGREDMPSFPPEFPVVVSSYTHAAQPLDQEEEPVSFQADDIVNDEQNQIVTASGNVVIEQTGRRLEADKIVYHLRGDKVHALGNVALYEPSGDLHRADEVQLMGGMKDGFVKGLRTVLTDGSRFKAREGTRKDGRKTVMKGASYTPCEPCQDAPESAPLWQISAAKVTHYEDEGRISYQHATFDIWGVPVMYTPYFSHPDGSVKRKSGFVSPRAGYKSDFGFFAGTNYYWGLAPDKDLTVGMMGFGKENPLATAQWRQRWSDSSLLLNGSLTKSERIDSLGGVDVPHKEETRGHIEGAGIWDIDQKWRAGLNIDYASDDQYLRQYDLSSEDVLENELYMERFSGRHYAAGRLLAFQDVRVREEKEDQPNILPEIIAGFKGEPWSVPILGGRWDLEGSFLGVQRSGDAQDMNRISGNAGWFRRFVSDFGLLAQADVDLRYDLYNTRDSALATPGSGRSRDTVETRFFPQFHFETSYPFIKPLEKAQLTMEPVVAITAAPNINLSDDIPNEDSQDVQIDSSNLFEPNRFPGLDRVEDQSRLTYGLRSGVYGYKGSHANIFVGQSYRLEDDDNPFPEGSGLDNQSSDFVGQLSLNQTDRYVLDYRFQLDSKKMMSQRHEIDLFSYLGPADLAVNYLFAKGLEGTDIQESREQIQGALGYRFSPGWKGRLGATQDLGTAPGLRRAYVGLDYFGQCFSWSLTGQRNLTDDSSGDSSTEVMFRVGLKNLGGFDSADLPE